MPEWKKGDLIEFPSSERPSGWTAGIIDKIEADGRIKVANRKTAGAFWLLEPHTTIRRVQTLGTAPSGTTVVTGLQPDPPQAVDRLAQATGHQVLPSPVAPPQNKSGIVDDF